MKVIRLYPLASYFVLAFAITWTCQLTAIILAPSQGMSLSNETNLLYFVDLVTGRLSIKLMLVYGMFTLGAGPLFAALFVTWVTEGKHGVRILWEQATNWRIGVRWYVVAFMLPIVLSAVSLGIGLIVGNGTIDFTPKLPFTYFLPLFLYMVVFTGITEEPGWRGFALPRLQHRYTAERASWILGPLWGLWHFPFIIYYNDALGIVPLLFSLLGLTLGIVGWTIVNTWLYNNTRSVWIMILLHGWGNTVQSYLVLSSNSPIAQALYWILPWVLASILLRVYGKDNLARYRRPQSYSGIP
jgi:hypothetical protein